MWQSRRAAKSTQSQNEKKTKSKELVLQVHERPFHEPIYTISVKKLNSLKHLVRATVAGSHN